jgi:NAD(P)-dependent dehydrogenase (short-subunit alcohol dehydrogenase family)
MNKLNNGFILVTGASTGIGKECTLRLARTGFQVFAGVRRQIDADSLQTLGGGNVIPVMMDITRAEQIAEAAKFVEKQTLGCGLRGLVNNAGIVVAGPIEILPIEQFRRQLEVNTIAQVAVTQAFLPLLRKAHEPATIVNISSKSGRLATPFLGAYAASKFALEAATDSLRTELRPWGIRVVCIEPGDIATPIREKTLKTSGAILDALPESVRRHYQPLIELAIQKVGSKQGIPALEVAKVVEHALTAERPKARYLIGRDARFALLISRLPVRLRDWLIKRKLPSYGDD